MKRLLYLLVAAMMVLVAVSCDKDKPGNDNSGKNGGDGKTPLPKAVDIGLVMDGKKILWADCNLGAAKEWEYGDYYAWGETETYYSSLFPLGWRKNKGAGYNWASYRYAKGTEQTLTKYCGNPEYGDGGYTDSYTKLLPADDAAHAKLGGKWRMPTVEEMEALLAFAADGAHYEWDRNAFVEGDDGNNYYGARLTWKETGASIFLPYAGGCEGTSVGIQNGDRCFLWTSTFETETPSEADNIYIRRESDKKGTDSYDRFYGFPIRPVCEE